MKPAKNIEKLIKNAEVYTNAGMDEVVLGDVLQAFEKSKEKRSATPQHNMWRIIMKSRITRVATATVIIVAVMIGVNRFGGSVDGTTAAFADVLEQIYRARTVTYKQTFQPEGRPAFIVEKMITEAGLIRSVLPHGNILISDISGGKDLQLMPDSKRAILTHRVGRPREKRLFNYIEWVSNLHERPGEFKGQEEVDGQMADLFIVQEGDFRKITVWVDPETNLPIRVERVNIPNPDENIIAPRMSLRSSDFGEDMETYTNEEGRTAITRRTSSVMIGHSSTSGGIQEKTTIVMSDFVWDAVLDESLFSLEPPEGYTVEEKQFDASEPDEKCLIEALAFWAEMSEGLFPAAINDLGDPNQVRPMLVAKFDEDDEDGDAMEEFEQALKMMNKILKGLMFAQEQKVAGSWGYAGEGVRLGEVDTPICWWKPHDSDDYRVIYGDLSVGNSP